MYIYPYGDLRIAVSELSFRREQGITYASQREVPPRFVGVSAARLQPGEGQNATNTTEA